MPKELNIYQKLIEVRKAVPYLKKDNKGHQFNYVSSSQTLGSLKEKMDELSLLLVPEVTRHETRDHTTKKGAHKYFTILDVSFTWVNAEKPEESISCPWIGHGLDHGEKGIGKAFTYAEKYFMLKFFNIPTDKDDPDSFQKKYATPEPPPKKTAGDFLEYLDKQDTLEKVDNWKKNNKAKAEELLDEVELHKLWTQWEGIRAVFAEQKPKLNQNI